MGVLRWLLMSGLVAVAGCGPFFLEAEIPEACYQVRQQVPGARDEVSRPVRLQLPLAFDLGRPVNGPDVTVELLRIELTSTGEEGLGFLDSLELLEPSGCGLAMMRAGVAPCAPGAALLRYERQGEVGPRIELRPDAPLDLSRQIEDGTVRLDAVVAGRLPEEAWTLDTKACFRIASELSSKFTGR